MNRILKKCILSLVFKVLLNNALYMYHYNTYVYSTGMLSHTLRKIIVILTTSIGYCNRFYD
jgi:hypothetical protein